MSKSSINKLRSKLGAVRRKLVRVEVVRRLAGVLSTAVVGLALLLLVDWLVDLSMDARVAVLSALGTLVAVLLVRALVALVTQRRDEESLALLVEHEEPGFRSRLIASVQFAQGKASVPDRGAQEMVERLVADTESYAEPLALTRVVNTGPLRRALLVALLLGGLAAGAYFAGGVITRDLLQRAFLSDVPVPRETRVLGTTGDLKVGIGDAVTIEARVEGHQPDRGTLRVRFASGRKLKLPMERREGESASRSTARYAATIENVQESFTYLAAVHDGRSEKQRVRALPRPTVVEVTGRQTYPEYTNLPSTTHKPGEFLLFPGSELVLEIVASQPLRNGDVRLLGGQAGLASFVDETDPRILRARFRAEDERLTGFTVEMLDAEGMRSKDATVYRIDILKDEPPRVRIVRPSRQRELVTAGARVLVGYEAEDRFGIERIELSFAQPGIPIVQKIELPLPEEGAKKLAESFDWELGNLSPPLKVGDEIEFWLEAYDENGENVGGMSAVRVLKVVTPREKRDDLLSRVGDSLGRIGQATDDQERLNAVLADWIRSQRSPSPQNNGNE